jgi:hypothetical protein
MISKKRITRIIAAGARTAVFVSDTIDGNGLDDLFLAINLTAFTGTNVIATLEGSTDGGTTWWSIVPDITSIDAGASAWNPTTPSITLTGTGMISMRYRGPLLTLLRVNATGTFTTLNMTIDAVAMIGGTPN